LGQTREAFAATAELSDALSSFLVCATRHIEMLRHDFKGEADPKPEPIAAAGDSSESVLDLIEGIIDASSPGVDQVVDVVDVVDVVEATGELDRPRLTPPACMAVCLPPSNQGVWTDDPPNGDDPRWVWGPPPRNKANYAWIMQTLYLLLDGGVGILLLSNSPLVSSEGAERDLRARFARSGALRCVISLPGGLFADDRPPASVIVLAKGRPKGAEVLFIDLQDRGETLGVQGGQAVRRLPASVVRAALGAYRAWLSGDGYADIPGYSASVDPARFAECGDLLAPWAYT
jgi:hypothetical protein